MLIANELPWSAIINHTKTDPNGYAHQHLLIWHWGLNSLVEPDVMRLRVAGRTRPITNNSMVTKIAINASTASFDHPSSSSLRCACTEGAGIALTRATNESSSVSRCGADITKHRTPPQTSRIIRSRDFCAEKLAHWTRSVQRERLAAM